jgi:hypothetical protein
LGPLRPGNPCNPFGAFKKRIKVFFIKILIKSLVDYIFVQANLVRHLGLVGLVDLVYHIHLAFLLNLFK